MAQFVVKNIVNYPVTYGTVTIDPDDTVDLLQHYSAASIKNSIINGVLYDLIIGRSLSIVNPYRDQNSLGLTEVEHARLVAAGFFKGFLGSEFLLHPLTFDSEGKLKTIGNVVINGGTVSISGGNIASTKTNQYLTQNILDDQLFQGTYTFDYDTQGYANVSFEIFLTAGAGPGTIALTIKASNDQAFTHINDVTKAGYDEMTDSSGYSQIQAAAGATASAILDFDDFRPRYIRVQIVVSNVDSGPCRIYIRQSN